MRVQQAVWSGERIERRRGQWRLRSDLLAVVTMCVIFGLQILVAMQSVGGSEAMSMVASEGMQAP
ncbi:MAG: hypothetical protein ABSC95_23920 [Acetobacteraceae bacterium]